MWLFEGSEYNPPSELNPKEIYGFVYLIENKINGRKYIGKKFLFRKKVLPITKTRKRRKHTLIESDWRDYFGSSEELLNDVKKYGSKNFTRIILHFCKNKAECAYLELYEQVTRNVLLSEEYYNSWISARVRKSHLKDLSSIYNQGELK